MGLLTEAETERCGVCSGGVLAGRDRRDHEESVNLGRLSEPQRNLQPVCGGPGRHAELKGWVPHRKCWGAAQAFKEN